MDACQLDIIVPCYNEAENIVATLQAFSDHIKTPFRVLICYDFEEDTTLSAVRSYDAPFPVEFVRNHGRGAHSAVCSGFAASNTGAVLVWPADDDYNGHIIDPMHALFKDGHDIVAASRFMPGGGMEGAPLLKSFLQRSASFTLRLLARLPVQDASNGLRLFSRRVLDSIAIESTLGFTYSIELLVKAHRLRWPIAQTPAKWFERTKGSSRFQVLKWAPHYLRWYFFAFATTWLRQGPSTVSMKESK